MIQLAMMKHLGKLQKGNPKDENEAENMMDVGGIWGYTAA